MSKYYMLFGKFILYAQKTVFYKSLKIFYICFK